MIREWTRMNANGVVVRWEMALRPVVSFAALAVLWSLPVLSHSRSSAFIGGSIFRGDPRMDANEREWGVG